MAREQHAILGKRVQVRRPRQRVAKNGKAFAAPLVGSEEKDFAKFHVDWLIREWWQGLENTIQYRAAAPSRNSAGRRNECNLRLGSRALQHSMPRLHLPAAPR
jgi:hypothetical protein